MKWLFHVAVLLLNVAWISFSMTSDTHSVSSNGPDDCCSQFYPRRLNKNLIKSYYLTDHRCPKSAVIFVTKKLGRHICVDPTLSWAESIMKYVDESSF